MSRQPQVNSSEPPTGVVGTQLILEVQPRLKAKLKIGDWKAGIGSTPEVGFAMSQGTIEIM